MPAPIRSAFMVPISTGRPTAAVVTAPRHAKMAIVITTAASLRRVVAVMARLRAKASHRPFALHGDAGAGAGVRPVIPHRAMLGAAVIPEGDRILGPAEAALEQRVLCVLVEIAKDRVALVAGNADDVAREAAVDIERLLARYRVRAQDRMLGARIARLVGDAVIGIKATISLLAIMQRGQTIEIGFHALRQRLIGRI